MSALDKVRSMPPERRQAILDRAEQLIRKERVRRSSEQPQDIAGMTVAAIVGAVVAAALGDLGGILSMKEYLKNAAYGILGGLIVGYLLGITMPPKVDDCKARVSSQHVSLCLDGKLDKAARFFRDR